MQLAQWWGPRDFTNPRCEIDPRPGGNIRIDMRAPDGTLYPMDGVIEEIEEPARIVFTARAFNATDDKTLIEDRVTATFAEKDGQTIVTVHVHVLELSRAFAEATANIKQGWSQSLERLEGST